MRTEQDSSKGGYRELTDGHAPISPAKGVESSPEDKRVLLGWDSGETEYTMACYFARGAGVLCRERLAAGDDHGLEFPWLYCWRQAFELMLKAVIVSGVASWTLPPESTHHDLDTLYKQAAQLRPKVKSEKVDEAVGFLANLDPDGASLRYPRTKDGKNALDFRGIWVRETHEGLQAAIKYLGQYAVNLPDGIQAPGKRGT